MIAFIFATKTWDFRRRSRDWWPHRVCRCSRCLRSPSCPMTSRNRCPRTSYLGPDPGPVLGCSYRGCFRCPIDRCRCQHRWGIHQTLWETKRWTKLPRCCSDHRDLSITTMMINWFFLKIIYHVIILILLLLPLQIATSYYIVIRHYSDINSFILS